MRGSLLVFVFFVALTEAELNYPKCCGPDQLLRLNLTCDTFQRATVQIIAKEYAGLFNNCSECVDFLVTDESHKLVKVSCDSFEYQVLKHEPYHKCCPVGYAYDTLEHRCVFTSEEFNGTALNPISFGLSTCPTSTYAIADYILDATIPVEEGQSVSLPNGKRFKPGTYCLDKTLSGNRVLRACEKYRDVCTEDSSDGKVRCLRKCCPDGFIYGPAKGRCSLNVTFGINLNLTYPRVLGLNNTEFAIITAPTRKKFMAKPTNKFHLDELGIMHVGNGDEIKHHSPDVAYYCIETVYRGGTSNQSFFLFIQNPSNVKYYINNVFSAISCFFLILTIVLYCTIPDMLNLFGKSIVCYCAIAAVAFGILAIITYSGVQYPNVCKAFGYLMTFSFLGSFTWLNVICFDMWMAFGTMRVVTIGNRRSDLKKFLWYSLYGWGVPTVITLLIVICINFPILPEIITPHIGKTTCFLEKSNYGQYLFFILPTGLCIFANFVLFLKTIRYYIRVKNDINGMKDTGNSDKDKTNKFQIDKEKLAMLTKLFLVMGISWFFETITEIVDVKQNMVLQVIETIWDAFNSLQGFFVFLIFMGKKVLQIINSGVAKRKISEASNNTSATNMYSAERNDHANRSLVGIADKQL